MVHLILEDGNSDLKGRYFPLGDGIRKYLTNLLNTYEGDKGIPGYKRLCNILEMPNGIEYNELKRIKNFFDNFNGDKKSNEYILNGGDMMAMWVNNTLNTATKAIEGFKQAKKEAGFQNSYRKTHSKDRQNKTTQPTISKFQTKNLSKNIANNDAIKYVKENRTIYITKPQARLIREFYDREYYDGFEEIFRQFFSNKGGKLNWNLINANMYKKALEEFVQYGEFVRFPTKYVYQWIGIIRKNTAILEASTAICGHTNYFPEKELETFFSRLYDVEEVFFNENNGDKYVSYEITKEDVLDICSGLNEDYAVHKNGQYNLFLDQDEVDEYDARKELNDIVELIDEFNKSNTTHHTNFKGKAFTRTNKFISIDYKNIKIYYNLEVTYALQECGLYDFLVLPDGSDAISDYGLAPLYRLLEQYDEDMSPEEAIVLLNKLLDIYHRRGDLASAFIEGGSSTLSQISGT